MHYQLPHRLQYKREARNQPLYQVKVISWGFKTIGSKK